MDREIKLLEDFLKNNSDALSVEDTDRLIMQIEFLKNCEKKFNATMLEMENSKENSDTLNKEIYNLKGTSYV